MKESVDKISVNAMAIAEYLSGHPKIAQVRYPDIKGDLGHSTAVKQMQNGFGRVLAFDAGNSQEDAKKFIGELKIICHAVSLGATESLICIPYLTTLLYMPPERRTIFGVYPNTIRLSAGIEKTEILLKDLEQALGKIEIKPKSKANIKSVQEHSKGKGNHYANIRI